MSQEQQGGAQEEKSGFVLARNFLVAIYRDPTGIRLKGQKGTDWLLGSKNNQPRGGRGLSGERDTGPGLSPFQPPGLLLVASLGFSSRCTARTRVRAPLAPRLGAPPLGLLLLPAQRLRERRWGIPMGNLVRAAL